MSSKRWMRLWLLIGSGAGLVTLSCAGTAGGGGADQSSEGSSGGSASRGTDDGVALDPADNGGTPDGNAGTGGTSSVPVVAPEKEENRDFEAPQAGARFVFVANTARDTVAIIDSTNLTIRTVEVGDKPARLVTVPGRDIALVINAGSRDVSVLRTSAADTTVTTVQVVPGANRISVAPGGAHAIAWYDATTDDGASTSGSFQDMSLIRLGDTADKSFALTVGFKPREVQFSQDGTQAFVITEDGISVVRLAEIQGPARPPLVALGTGKMAASDVSVTPDGLYALWREEGKNEITLVELATRVARKIDLLAQVTDLDLAPDASYIAVVLPTEKALVRIPVPGGFTDPLLITRQVIADETIGAAELTPDGKFALLYTTASAVERVVVAAMDGSAPPRGVSLHKLVRSVTISPDSKSAVVVHRKAEGSLTQAGIDAETRIDRSFGYSVVSLADGFAKLQVTAAEPGAMAITPDSTRVFVLLRDDATGLRITQRIDLGNFLIEDFELGSPPLAVSALSAQSHQVFVSQLHPAGRISFIDWMSGETKSVTGFELNGRIVE